MKQELLLLFAGSIAMCSGSMAWAEGEPVNEPFIKSVGAWLLVQEDDTLEGFNYWNSNSSYQALIQNDVYNSVDILCISLIDTVQVNATTYPSSDHGGTGWTLHFTGGNHNAGGQVSGAPPMPPGGYTNQNYFEQIITDARAANSHIRITVGSLYEPDTLSRIFADPNNPTPEEAESFAENVSEFCLQHGVNGYDIDFEGNLVSGTTADQFNNIMHALGEAFNEKSTQAYGGDLWLLMTPALNGNLQLNGDSAAVINQYFYAMNLQEYNGQLNQDWTWEDLGVNRNLFGYTGTWEPTTGQPDPPTPAQVIKDNAANKSQQIMMYRLNSGPTSLWSAEQLKQKQLYSMVFPDKGDIDFDGDVDTDDLNALHDALGINNTDVNNNGCVDIDDLLYVIEDWSDGCTP
ncbi:MAG: glycoside hydrolase family 18 protein [Phycisphaerales bacterium]|nr:glycoside hydrolase family 18 protein [Phycisphaerales bacterium]